jgi:hypothetical protein
VKAEAHVWLPIESAPKDGRSVRCRDGEGNEKRCFWSRPHGFWAYTNFYGNIYEDIFFDAIEWLPPTTPPPCGSEGKPK